jgi:hypothetical protein
MNTFEQIKQRKHIMKPGHKIWGTPSGQFFELEGRFYYPTGKAIPEEEEILKDSSLPKVIRNRISKRIEEKKAAALFIEIEEDVVEDAYTKAKKKEKSISDIVKVTNKKLNKKKKSKKKKA